MNYVYHEPHEKSEFSFTTTIRQFNYINDYLKVHYVSIHSHINDTNPKSTQHGQQGGAWDWRVISPWEVTAVGFFSLYFFFNWKKRKITWMYLRYNSISEYLTSSIVKSPIYFFITSSLYLDTHPYSQHNFLEVHQILHDSSVFV